MKVYHFKSIERQENKIIVGIGKFDGVHLGHQKILKKIIELSEREKSIPSVFTFRHFPAEFYLSPWESKLSLLEKSGIKICIWSDFEEISFWKPDEFLNFLFEKGTCGIVVGFNFRFGEHKKGDVEFLKKKSEEKNVIVEVVNGVKIDGEVVNSTSIRNFLKKGEIEKVNKFLGRYFSFKGKVITGSCRGRKLGFPTANIYLDNKLMIGNGVYAGYIFYKDKFFKAAINIGAPITFGEKEKRIEVHIIGFEKEIYGEILEIFMVRKVREEKCFSSEKELEEQIKKDVEFIKSILPDLRG
ncbi:bifunctional riboflavin kinase/FAD synthetase [bacterium]|nr:bifunctional riboflavin kinase/FAD synthetase [bacterium]